MNTTVNDWRLDSEQLNIDRYNNRDEPHASNILAEVPKLTRDRFRSTPALLNTATSIEYLNKLSPVECGALHEMANFAAVQCHIKKHNVCCCHNFDFKRYDDIPELFLWNQMVWIELFAIRYMLYQKWYLEEWYIKEKDFTNIQALFFKYDIPDLISFFSTGERRNKTTQKFQRRVWKILMKQWVDTTKSAMTEFVNSEGIIPKDSWNENTQRVIPITPILN